jgi:signal transduction histidine kinase
LLIVRQGYDGATLANVVLLVLAATSIGYVSRLAVRAERDLTRASAERAAGQERERLARSIHDGVLQVLALVQRRGSELGGGAAELGRLAGDQEAALRALITSTARPAAAGVTDLAASLAAVRSAAVTVSLPAEPVLVDSERAGELLAAVGAALENVRRHAGPDARTWVLLEALGGEVVVTVRDDGTGIPAGRIEEAAAQGRLGISMSIRGRMDALGGTATVTAEAGEGTEVELRAPMR